MLPILQQQVASCLILLILLTWSFPLSSRFHEIIAWRLKRCRVEAFLSLVEYTWNRAFFMGNWMLVKWNFLRYLPGSLCDVTYTQLIGSIYLMFCLTNALARLKNIESIFAEFHWDCRQILSCCHSWMQYLWWSCYCIINYCHVFVLFVRTSNAFELSPHSSLRYVFILKFHLILRGRTLLNFHFFLFASILLFCWTVLSVYRLRIPILIPVISNLPTNGLIPLSFLLLSILLAVKI